MISEPGNTGIPEGQGIWEHFTMQDGLPDMKIEAVFEDSRGVLWIGTHDRGVVRYEGDGFQTFTRRDGLVGNGVFSILEDREGCLWLGTDQGLSRYDGNEFQKVEIAGESCSFLWGSCMDEEGMLWFGLEGRPGHPPAVCRWDGKQLERIYLTDTIRKQGLSIHQIVVDPRGGLWCGGHGLYRYDGENCSSIEYNTDPFEQIISLLILDGGILWLASDKGLYAYKAGLFNELNHMPNDTWVEALQEDKVGTVWANTSDGRLLSYDGNAVKLMGQKEAIFWRGSCQDYLGRLWISSYGMGLYCYDSTRIKIFQMEQGLPANCVHCLAEDAEGNLWIGTTKGLVNYDGIRFRLIERDGNTRVCITGLLVDRSQRVWIGTRNGYLYVYEDGALRGYLPIPEMRGCSIGILAEDHDDRIWFSSRYGKGFGYYQKGDWTYFSPDESGTYPGWVGALEVDQAGSVWLGSASPVTWDGLCRYDGRSFERVEGLSGSSVRVICEDRNGHLWIGTNEGICFYDGTSMVTFTQEDGLSCEIITAITEAEDGTLWIGTEGGGVCCYDGSVMQVIQIPGNPGYNMIHAIHQDRHGRLWFGTEDGLIQYIPRQVRPKVEIAEVIADRTYTGEAKVQVPSTISRVRFCFRGKCSQDYPSSLVYRYRLHGYDDDCRQTREKQVEYSQLKSDKYTLVVHAVDCDLNYSESASVELDIAEDSWIALLNKIPDLERVGLSRGSGNLLIADDDPIFTRSCRCLLEKMGYVVQVASTAQDALQVQEEHPCDLVLLDASLPKVTGVYMLRALRQRNNPEIIVLADYKDLETAMEATRLGANSYLPKPFEAHQLLAQIDQALVMKKDPLIVYIRTHLDKTQTRDEVAKRFNVSPGTILNRVKKITQRTFSQFQQACRIEEAQKLLAQTELDVQQIAVRTGFGTHAGLTHTFSQLTGRSPVQYRSECRSPLQ